MIRGARALGVSALNACAIVATGDVACWGKNYDGHLATGNDVEVGFNLVPGASGAQQVANHHFAACALDGEGSLRCWGKAIGPNDE
jgi:hypothetical protein